METFWYNLASKLRSGPSRNSLRLFWKVFFTPLASLNVARVSEERGPGGDFTTERMCLAQLSHFSISATWFQVNSIAHEQ